jgi:hypothetical protein
VILAVACHRSQLEGKPGSDWDSDPRRGLRRNSEINSEFFRIGWYDRRIISRNFGSHNGLQESRCFAAASGTVNNSE